MTSGVKMVKYGGGGLLVFSEPLTKGSRGLSYIFLITLHPATFITVDDPTLLHHRILIFGGHWKVLDGSTSLEVYLYTKVTAFVSSSKLCVLFWRNLNLQLLFSLSDDSDTSEDVSPSARTTPAGTQVQLEEDREEEEDFQMVPLEDEH